MNKIKSFIYLDSYKMYSISSQLFEGLTEYIVNYEKKGVTESDQQKGDFGSGRLMADIIESDTSRTEKKFLHDYSYNLFEDELMKSSKVIEINDSNVSIEISKIHDYSFIKVTNRIAFNDTKLIEDLISKFNDIGLAITYVTKINAFNTEIEAAKAIVNNIQDRNQKSKAQQVLSKKFNPKELAKQNNLSLDEEFLKNLRYMLNFGYNGQFEVQIPFYTEDEIYLFSCVINRDMLIENENSIIKKYSRETEKKFTVFGILTQTKDIQDKISLYRDASDKVKKSSSEFSMKEVMMNMVALVTNLEKEFVGKLGYEYIIDPIAIYREI